MSRFRWDFFLKDLFKSLWQQNHISQSISAICHAFSRPILVEKEKNLYSFFFRPMRNWLSRSCCYFCALLKQLFLRRLEEKTLSSLERKRAGLGRCKPLSKLHIHCFLDLILWIACSKSWEIERTPLTQPKPSWWPSWPLCASHVVLITLSKQILIMIEVEAKPVFLYARRVSVVFKYIWFCKFHP